tara:strand:- start:410 stop:640 length:231 start_codon:yes stop_codon:yes gene_type:complete
MDSQEVLKTIKSLRGRRAYEEKRDSKFGFTSSYEYIEDKIKKKSLNNQCKQEEMKTSDSISVLKNKRRGCCLLNFY